MGIFEIIRLYREKVYGSKVKRNGMASSTRDMVKLNEKQKSDSVVFTHHAKSDDHLASIPRRPLTISSAGESGKTPLMKAALNYVESVGMPEVLEIKPDEPFLEELVEVCKREANSMENKETKYITLPDSPGVIRMIPDEACRKVADQTKPKTTGKVRVVGEVEETSTEQFIGELDPKSIVEVLDTAQRVDAVVTHHAESSDELVTKLREQVMVNSVPNLDGFHTPNMPMIVGEVNDDEAARQMVQAALVGDQEQSNKMYQDLRENNFGADEEGHFSAVDVLAKIQSDMRNDGR